MSNPALVRCYCGRNLGLQCTWCRGCQRQHVHQVGSWAEDTIGTTQYANDPSPLYDSFVRDNPGAFSPRPYDLAGNSPIGATGYSSIQSPQNQTAESPSRLRNQGTPLPPRRSAVSSRVNAPRGVNRSNQSTSNWSQRSADVAAEMRRSYDPPPSTRDRAASYSRLALANDAATATMIQQNMRERDAERLQVLLRRREQQGSQGNGDATSEEETSSSDSDEVDEESSRQGQRSQSHRLRDW